MRKLYQMYIPAITLSCLLFSLIVSGCSSSSNVEDDSDADDQGYTGYLTQVENDAQFERLLKSAFQQNSAPEIKTTDPLDTTAPAESDLRANEDFSNTTLIENGVDEMDLVKFDGDIIYQSHQSKTGQNEVRLLRVDDDTASTSLVSTIQTSAASDGDSNADIIKNNNSHILGLYLHTQNSKKTLAILSQQYFYNIQGCDAEVLDCISTRFGPVYWANEQFVIEYYDVTKAASPALTQRNQFNGSFLQSRRVGNTLYTVSSIHIGVKDYNYAARSKTEIETNDTLLENLSFSDLIPQITQANGDKKDWFTSKDCYIPEGISSSAYQLQLTVITSSDLESDQVNANCFLGYSQDFYASTNALYFSEGFDWYSKDSRIHQFDFSGLKVNYAGSGTVIGRIGGKFKMSEHEGYLRVVSSQQNFMEGPTDDIANEDMDDVMPIFAEVPDARHYLSVLEKVDNKRELKLVSRIPNQIDDTHIGKDGEDIFATRFIKDRAYIVTFLRTDPFYTIDLSDPLAPVVAGELEIPGFSTQLFPVNDDYILGVGRDNAFKLDLYNVSDINNPVRSAQFQFEPNFYSPSLYDHHSIAMLYDQDSASMKVTLPAQSYGINQADASAGLYLFELDATLGTITEAGKLITGNNDALSTQWNSIYGTRSIIDGDNFHFVTPQPVYSAPWSDPSDVSITQ